jgi:hypothetical protein
MRGAQVKFLSMFYGVQKDDLIYTITFWNRHDVKGLKDSLTYFPNRNEIGSLLVYKTMTLWDTDCTSVCVCTQYHMHSYHSIDKSSSLAIDIYSSG